MKNRKLRTILLAALIFCLTASLLLGCGSASGDVSSSSDDTSGTSDTDTDESETIQMVLDDETTVDLIELETGEGSIYGEYYCSSDDSVWSFGGDILGIAFDEDDGTQRCYICYLTFYQTAEPEDDGTYQLCLGITNILEGVTSYWYAGNIVDDDENVIGVALIDPSDTSSYISLVILEDDDEEE